MKRIYENAPLVAGVLTMTASGSIYLVSLYQSSLESALGFSADEISTVTTIINAGTWCSVLPGIFFDYYGPKPTQAFGTVLLLAGYLLMAAAASGKFSVNIYTACIFGFMYGHGSSWMQTAAMASNTANTASQNRGKVIGLLLANFSLASGIYTQLYDVMFEGAQVGSYLLFCGAAMALASTIAYPSIHLMERRPHETDMRLYFPVGVVTGVIVCAIILSTLVGGSSLIEWGISLVYASYFVMIGIASITMLTHYGTKALSFTKVLNPTCTNTHSIAEAVETVDERMPFTIRDTKVTAAGPRVSMTMREALSTLDFWLLFVCFCAGVSSGITILDSLNEIIDAKGEKGVDDEAYESMKVNAVALFSACNSGTRFLTGVLSDNVKVSRSTLLATNLVFTTGVQLLWAYTGISFIYTGTFLTAVSYGATWALVPGCTVDFFGPESFGSIWGLMMIAAMIGTEVCYDDISVMIYSTNADDAGCFGDPACFYETFLFLAAFSGVASIAGLILTRIRSSSPNSKQGWKLSELFWRQCQS